MGGKKRIKMTIRGEFHKFPVFFFFFFSKSMVLPRGEQKIAHRVRTEGTVLFGELK